MEEAATPPKLLKIPEVAEIIGVQEKTIKEWMRLKKAPPHLKLNGCVRFDPKVLSDWINARAQNAA